MRKSLVELAGHDPQDPAVLGAKEDFERLAIYVDTLVDLREAASMTQTEVAQRMGTTQSAVSDLERTGSNPRIDTLQRYARAVGHPLRFRNPVIQGTGRLIQVTVPTGPRGSTDWKKTSWSQHWTGQGETQVRASPLSAVS